MRAFCRALLVVLLAVLSASCGRSHQDAGTVGDNSPAPTSSPGPDAPLVLPGEAARFVNQGVAEYRQGRYHEASAAFEKAKDLVPADLRTSMLLGTALLQAKLYTPAQAEFRRILAIHPDAVDPRLGLARIAIRLGDYDQAIPIFREVLQLDPNNLQAIYNLGLLRYRAGDYEESTQLLERVIALKPDLPDAHYTLGLAYVRLNQDARAEAEFRKAVELAPQNSQAHFNLAKVYLRAGKKDEAEREQETFKKLWDRQAADRAAEGTARELYLAADYAGALKEFDRLTELNPLSGRFQLGRGQCFLKMGRKEDALAAFQKATDLDPKLPDAHFHLAVLYQERGEAEKSEKERLAFEALETIGENKTGF
jgi:tetratricopeptide (TPR) repeat protein